MRAVPVTIVTGASEAQLAGLPLAAARVAVVLQGADTLDAAATEPVPLIGCACCRVGGGLAPALLGLLRAASRGEVAGFERVLVSAPEGAASAVLLEHLASPALAAAFRVASVVALSSGEDAAIADHVAPDLAQAGLPWLEPMALPAGLGDPGAIRAGGDDAREAFILGWEAPQPIAAVGEWLDSLVSASGARLLRLHGMVRAAEGAFSLQAVRHVLGPPVRLAGDGEGARAPGSRLRVVTRGLEPLDLGPAWAFGAAR